MLFALLAAPAVVPAQPLATVATPPRSDRGTPAVHQLVRDAQAGFERRRRSMLPVYRYAANRCDVPIGRYCYWYDEHGPAGPPEPERVGAARRRLIAALDSAAAVDPADPLAAGQRVRYLIEDGSHERAALAAGECAAAAWWCQALRGWAHHAAGRAGDAEAAYDSALAAMPATERCHWSDVSTLLEGDARARYRRLACDDRAATERRFWWLATPFFTRGANDRRNEHFARRTLARLAAESPTAYQTRWSDDMEELLIRYGWAERWSRREDDPPGAYARQVSVVGHEASPAYRWTADGRLLDDPDATGDGGWAPRDHEALERLASPHVRHLVEIHPQVALLRRGDSLLAVTWFRRPDTLPLRASRASLVLAREGEPAMVAPFGADGAEGHLVATAVVSSVAHIVGIEMPGDSGVVAWGRRFVAPGAHLRGALAISDILPHLPTDGPAPSLEDAALLALPDGRARAGDPVAVYWEVYGLADGAHEEVETTVSIVGGRPGLAARLWNRLRGRAPGSPVQMRWTDRVLSRGGVAARSVTIGIPQLEPGVYTLRLAVRAGDGRMATTSRAITVAR